MDFLTMNKILLFALIISFSACGVGADLVTVAPKDKNYYSGLHYKFSMDERMINVFFKKSDKLTDVSNTPPALRLPLDQAFLKIAKDSPKVKYKYGSFKFSESPSDVCNQLEIKDINFSETVIIILGDLCGTDFKMSLNIEQANTLEMNIQVSDTTFNRLTLVSISAPEEQIFGMGEQFSHANLRGHRVPVWVQEQGVGRGDQPLTGLTNASGGDPFTTYAPMPFFISSFSKSFQLHNTTRSVFDFQYANSIEIEVWDNELSASIVQMDDPLDLIEHFTEKTGRLAPLPEWAYGTILGIQGGTQVVMPQLDKLLRANVPISAIWVQDWCGKQETPQGSQLRWHWQADSKNYPNFKGFCEKMNERGVAVLGYNNPFMTDSGSLFQTAKEQSFFVKNNLGEDYLIEMPGMDAYLIDLTNPAAFNWMKSLIKIKMINVGLSGWMADYAEGLPWDAVLHSGISPQEYHNIYPIEWARLNREVIRETGNEGKIAFFSRSSFTGGSQHSTFYWAGDQTTYWQQNDGLPSVVPALLSSGMSGISVNHADIGGSTSFKRMGVKIVRTEEMLKRWIELCTFTPIFRSHEGVLPDENVQVYDAEMQEFYGRFARIHERLRPYLQEQMEAATEKGYPIVRHLYLHYPKDKNTYDVQQQFLLGKDIMVAPAVQKGIQSIEVYIPQGEWRHLFTGEVFSGGLNYKINTPLGTPAVFVNISSKWKNLEIE